MNINQANMGLVVNDPILHRTVSHPYDVHDQGCNILHVGYKLHHLLHKESEDHLNKALRDSDQGLVYLM